MASRQHLERIVNSLQQALLLADHLHRTTDADQVNQADLGQLTLALKQAAAALDALRREKDQL
jgi:hypothetical protein